jgi:hypothetical protein
MIDADLDRRLRLIQARALRDGVNLFDALDEAGLLVTENQIKKQWANCLERLWMNVESQPVIVFTQMGGGQNAPLDAVRGILEYIDIFRKTFADQSKGT